MDQVGRELEEGEGKQQGDRGEGKLIKGTEAGDPRQVGLSLGYVRPRSSLLLAAGLWDLAPVA